MGCNRLACRTYDIRDELLGISKDKVISIDVETTGLDKDNDEILQVAICNGNGELLYSSYVRPEKRKRWPKAEEVNHISWDMVNDQRTLIEQADEIEKVLARAELIIGYNLDFDTTMLMIGRVNIPKVKQYDVMNDASILHGKWSDYHGDYSYVSLQKVAEIYGITFDAHNATNDARATASLFYAMLEGERMDAELSRREKIAMEQTTQENAERLKAEQEHIKAQKWPIQTWLIYIAIAVVFAIVFFNLEQCVGKALFGR